LMSVRFVLNKERRGYLVNDFLATNTQSQ
jgi:hypothetical protein